jgi:hypothetical protein
VKVVGCEKCARAGVECLGFPGEGEEEQDVKKSAKAKGKAALRAFARCRQPCMVWYTSGAATRIGRELTNIEMQLLRIETGAERTSPTTHPKTGSLNAGRSNSASVRNT